MNEIGVKQRQVKEQNFNKKIDSNRISNLSSITSSLLPKGYKLLPNTSELFELELAFKANTTIYRGGNKLNKLTSLTVSTVYYVTYRLQVKNEMIDLKEKTKKEKLANYFEDIDKVLSEMYRVLKPNKYTVIIIGSNDVQTGGIRLETKVEEFALQKGFILDNKIVKPIKGMRNTMKEEYILFLRKGEKPC